MTTEQMRQQSPLDQFYTRTAAGFSDESAGVVLEERAFLTHINLRGEPADNGFLSDTNGALGFALPLTPNTWAGGDEVRVCWLGPNEWLVLATGSADAWSAALRSANAQSLVAITSVGGGQTVLRLSGEKIRQVFAKGCTLDFHPREFSVGQCAQSTLGKAPALFIQTDEAPVYEVLIRRSFSDYIGHWLEDATREYGLRVVHNPSP